MIRKAVIDRFEEEFAVLLLEDGEQKLVITRTDLPPEAVEGHWLLVTFADEGAEAGILEITLDEDETSRARQRIADKLARLRRGDHLNDDQESSL